MQPLEDRYTRAGGYTPGAGVLPGLRSFIRANAPPASSAGAERVAALTDASLDGILFIDRQWRIAYANTTARVQARIEPGHLNRAIFWDLYPGVIGTEIEEAYRDVMATRKYRFVEAYHYPPFDTWADTDVVPIDGGIAVYWRDVTSRIKMQSARDQAAEHLYQVLEATTDQVMSVGRDWTIRYLNQHAREGLAQKGDLIGRNLWEAFPEADYEGSPDMYYHHRAMDQGIPGEYQTYSRGELQSWYDVITRPAPDGIIIFFRDVTRQKLAEAALVEMEKLSVAAQLSSAIAHEINTPLASLTNLIFLASQHAILPEVKHYLELADRELRRATGIASQSLRFHRQATLPKPVSCEDLFRGVLTTFESRLANAGVTVEKRKRAAQPVTCLEGDIRQVLNELVSNAVAGMPKGGRLQVRSREAVDPKSGERGLVLTVADNGVGIPASNRSKVLNAFFTTKGIGGVGLGLWISADIVSRHPGKLQIKSSTGKRHGTVVNVFLPYAPRVLEADRHPAAVFAPPPPPALQLPA